MTCRAGATGLGGLVLAGVVGLVGVALAPVAGAADADLSTSVVSWDTAAARLGTAGSLWEPARTAGLDRSRRITVIGDAITVTGAAATGGMTYAGTRYGRGARSVWVEEKWANTSWAAQPAVSTSRGLVGTVGIPLGLRGQRIVVPARVYAECVGQPATADATPPRARTRCTRADVRRFGGTIELTARPASTMLAPGDTTIVIRSTGLGYPQLVAIARSLQQVAGAPALGAGSAQMLGMCRQMIDGRMTADQASAFAASNGYTLRVGSIDGVPQAGTADYRPDRFTVSTVGGAVTGCTYG